MQSPVKVTAGEPYEINQGTLLLGAIIVGFIAFLAMNGKLQTYWGLLMGGAAPSGSAGAAAAVQPPATAAPNTTLTPWSTQSLSLIPGFPNIAMPGMGMIPSQGE